MVVLVVVALLCAILLPVIASAKSAARKAVCLSNFHQAHLAALLYAADYDDTFMPVNHQPAANPDPKTDTTWVQMLLPYVHSYGIFRCPADDAAVPDSEGSFDQDLVPGDIYSRYYSASLRTNLGYNYLYLAPIFRSGDAWIDRPMAVSGVSNPSGVLMFVDSIWDRDNEGNPVGGGNWLVVPPCRYSIVTGTEVDTFQVNGSEVFGPSGWQVDQANSGLQYGRAWPWHSGRATVIHVDGSATVLSPFELAVGCDVKMNWGGLVVGSTYVWAAN
jgi:type II secretory pathway pseudopilin PulG